MAKKVPVLVTLVVIGILSILTTSASANVVMGGAPTVVSSSSTSTVSAVEAAKIAGYSHVGVYVKVKKSQVKKRGCFWTKKGQKWTNTVVINGKVRTYHETTPAKLCPLKKPVKKSGVRFTYVKVAGGATGSPCWNLTIPPYLKQPRPQLKGKVLDLATLKFNVTIKLNASAKAVASATCVSMVNGKVVASASAYAEATGTATADVKISVYSKTKTSARSSASVSFEQKHKVEIDAQVSAVLNLQASVSANCAGDVYICPIGSTWNGERCAKDGTTTPPPPPEAPGPNPDPDPNEPFPGGWACYWIDTGAPAPIRPDGTCPVGSYGTPV